jgi:hypothetical protein
MAGEAIVLQTGYQLSALFDQFSSNGKWGGGVGGIRNGDLNKEDASYVRCVAMLSSRT